MQKIVIDTNVFVSTLIQRGYSYHIVNELFIEGKIDYVFQMKYWRNTTRSLKGRDFKNIPTR
jgi:predicted nucleic acid-binding protein